MAPPSKSGILTPVFQFLCALNAVFFIIYGFQSLYSQMMKDEFKRFGLSDLQRTITGGLQLLGAAGLFMGLIAPAIGILSAAGFTLMMFVAFLVRIRIKCHNPCFKTLKKLDKSSSNFTCTNNPYCFSTYIKSGKTFQ